jgi:hypothetical protein
VALVRSDPSDEEQIHPAVVEPLAEDRIAGAFVAIEVDGDRKDAGATEAKMLEVDAVELAVPEAEGRVRGQRCQTLETLVQDPVDLLVPFREEVRRGDVVELEHATAAQAREGLVHGRDEGVVKHHHVGFGALAPALERDRVRPGVLVVRVDVGGEAPGAESVAHENGGIADGISPMKGGHPLIDAARHRASPASSRKRSLVSCAARSQE